MTPRPHDALFKRAFEAPADAAPLLRELLPAPIAEAIAWETLAGEPASFVGPALTDSHGDRLFSARLRNVAGAVFLLLEHQSTDDAELPLRTLSYQLRIWERMRNEDPGARPAPIITMVVSHARGGWPRPDRANADEARPEIASRRSGEARDGRTTPTRGWPDPGRPRALAFEDRFDRRVLAIPGMATLVPRFSLVLDDLAHLSDDDLKARSLGAFQKLALWLLRDARDAARLLESFDAWRTEMLQVLHRPDGREAFATLITYLFRVIDPVHGHELHARIQQLGRRAEEATMTIADWLHQEGHKEGREEGREEGRVATLRSLLICKFKLQTLDDRYEARLRAVPAEALEGYLQRVLTASSLADVFED